MVILQLFPSPSDAGNMMSIDLSRAPLIGAAHEVWRGKRSFSRERWRVQ